MAPTCMPNSSMPLLVGAAVVAAPEIVTEVTMLRIVIIMLKRAAGASAESIMIE
jgi:hypothetical protein